MRPYRFLAMLLAMGGLAVLSVGCGDDEPATHTTDQLLGALLTVDDVTYIPGMDSVEENMRAVVENPAPPWENTLDPYLCTEAGTPMVLTLPQAQLELTGVSVMETLVASKDAEGLYSELDAAYKACGAASSLAYEPLAGVPSVGDESASYRSELGVVTIARFGTDLMVLKWMVGDYWDQAGQYYEQMVTTAAKHVTDL